MARSKAKKGRKTFLKKVSKVARNMGGDLGRTPLGRAARGKHTKGYI